MSEQKPYKLVRAVLLDPQGKEVCCGFHMMLDDEGGLKNLAEACEKAEKNLMAEFRAVTSRNTFLQEARAWTDEQTQAAVNSLIAWAGYRLDWFYSGWKERI